MLKNIMYYAGCWLVILIVMSIFDMYWGMFSWALAGIGCYLIVPKISHKLDIWVNQILAAADPNLVPEEPTQETKIPKKEDISTEVIPKDESYYKDEPFTQEKYNNLFNAIETCSSHYDIAYYRNLDPKYKKYLKLNAWLYFEGRLTESLFESIPNYITTSVDMLNSYYKTAESQCTGERFLIIKVIMEGGSDPWFSAEDLRNCNKFYEVNENGALRLGIVAEGYALTYKGEGSLISVGGAGSGKTQGQVLPNLCFYKNSVVILDIKGECYRKTAEYRQVVLGQKIIRFAPFDPDNSHYYNPISFIRQDPQYFWEDVREAAALFMIETPKDSYWEHAAREVLQGIIAYLSKAENANATIEGMLDILGSKIEAFEGEPKTLWEEFMLGLRQQSDIKAMARCANGIEDVYDKSPKQFIGVKDGLKAHLARWQGGNLEEVTKRSDWTPEDLLKEKTTLYITIPADKVDQYGELMRVFIAQHINALLRKEKDHGSEQEVLFMLDEFAKMGTIPEVQKGLEIGRSYGVRFWVFLQSLSQLDQLYENSEALLDNFYVQSYLDFPDKTAQNLSRKLGSNNGTLQANGAPLVTTQELQTNFADYMVVIGKGVKPAKLEKIVFYGLLEDKFNNDIKEVKLEKMGIEKN